MAICFNPGFFREKQARTAEQLLAEKDIHGKVSRQLPILIEGTSKLLQTFGILQSGKSAHIDAIKLDHGLLNAAVGQLNSLNAQLETKVELENEVKAAKS
jgi:hypothetical protein